jgi:hypothetical protein
MTKQIELKTANQIEEERYRKWGLKPKHYDDGSIVPFDREYTDTDARNEWLYNAMPPRCAESRREKQGIAHHREKNYAGYTIEVSELDRMLHVEYCKLKGKPIPDDYLPVSEAVEWLPTT